MTTAPPLMQPLSLRLLLDEAVRHARRNFRRVYPSVAIPMALVGGALPLVQAVLAGNMLVPGRGAPSPQAAFQAMGAAAIAGFVVGALYSLGYGAMLFGAVNVLATREVSMARAWLFTLRPRVLGTLLLKTIAVGFGFALCVLPGIYLGLIFSLTMPVMVEEGLFGTSAMRRSAELARYNPLRELEADPRLKVFLIVFVGMLLGYVASLVVQLPVIAIHQFMLFRDLAGGHRVDPVVMMWRLTWLQVPSTILSMLIQTAVYLYMSFGIALLFFDIKRRKEGLDLEVAIADVMASRGVVVAESAPPPSIGSPEKPQR